MSFRLFSDAAVVKLLAEAFDVPDRDAARLSPFVRHHVDMHGRYSFPLSEMPGGCPADARRMPGGLRPLREPEPAGV